MTTSRPKKAAGAAASSGAAEIEQLIRHNVRLSEIRHRSIDTLKVRGRKLRKRSPEAQASLRASVAAFGIVLPVLVDAQLTIIAGESVVEAARCLGYTEVPTIMLDHLDEAESRLLRIALNKLGEQGEWQSAELGLEFRELLELELDLAPEVTGFTSVEIDLVIDPPAVPGEQDDPDDAEVEVADGPAVSSLGDIWRLGNHRVLCGSSLDPENLARLMQGGKAQMVFSDSPFNVKISGHVCGKGRHREFAQASGEMSEAEFIAFQEKSTTTLAECCIDGALLYLCMDWRHMWEILCGIRTAGLKLINMAVWVKASGGMGSLYRSRHELIFVAKKGAAPHRNNVQLGRHGRNRDNCWFYAGVNSFGRNRAEQLDSHPTPKNVIMVADAIRDVTNRGELVLDGFLGSGTTLIAAERTGRVCYGVELDPLYVDAIVRRWEKVTGGCATLHGTGQTMDQVRMARAAAPAAAPQASAEVPRPEIAPRARRRLAA